MGGEIVLFGESALACHSCINPPIFSGGLSNKQVTRSKNKWKCTLKDGIMHLNNRDILFVKVCILSLHTQTLVS
jgi:hypothetical protein